jgi:flagellar hook-associated protein 3 FlgL
MRVTTANRFDTSIDTLQRRTSEMSEAQQVLISGKKVAKASDDPTAAARVERALAREARADASQRALEASRTAMTLAEGAMGDVSDLVQQARELIVQAGAPTYSDSQRADMAAAIRGIRNQLLQVANRDNGAGGYVFGAQGSAAPPFVDTPSGVQFRGTQGQLMAASGEPLPLTADGGAVLLQAMAGNGVFSAEPASANSGGAWINAGSVSDASAVTGDPYQVVFSVDATTGDTTYEILRDGSPSGVSGVAYQDGRTIEIDGLSFTVRGQPADGDQFDLTPAARDLSIFDALDRVASELAAPNRTNAQRAQTVNNALRDVDQSFSAIVSARAQMGVELNRTDAVESRLADGKLLAQTERSSAEDADMVQAVSAFSQKQTSYNAALQAYAMVQKLSLFDYIR